MSGRAIFITGGASGLGLALAQRCAKAGWRVAIGDLDDAKGASAVTLLSEAADVVYLNCDVTRMKDLEQARDALLARWGHIDVLVNNAGVAGAGKIEDLSLQDWEWILDINLMGVVRGCKAFVPVFKRQSTGHIVNIASMAGLMNAPLMSSYNVSKAGVVSLSETLLQELRDDGVGVSVVCPAFFKTNLTDTMRSDLNGVQKNVQKLMAASSITADDVAAEIFEAIESNTFWVLPHRNERWLWKVKRHVPEVFDHVMHWYSRRWLGKFGRQGA